MLLRSNDHSWPHETHECDHLVGSEAMAVDKICANQATCTAQASLAVDCDALLLFVDHDMCEVHELADEAQWRASTVIEDHVEVLDAHCCEM
jgi:hypothetical protein